MPLEPKHAAAAARRFRNARLNNILETQERQANTVNQCARTNAFAGEGSLPRVAEASEFQVQAGERVEHRSQVSYVQNNSSGNTHYRIDTAEFHMHNHSASSSLKQAPWAWAWAVALLRWFRAWTIGLLWKILWKSLTMVVVYCGPFMVATYTLVYFSLSGLSQISPMNRMISHPGTHAEFLVSIAASIWSPAALGTVTTSDQAYSPDEWLLPPTYELSVPRPDPLVDIASSINDLLPLHHQITEIFDARAFFTTQNNSQVFLRNLRDEIIITNDEVYTALSHIPPPPLSPQQSYWWEPLFRETHADKVEQRRNRLGSVLSTHRARRRKLADNKLGKTRIPASQHVEICRLRDVSRRKAEAMGVAKLTPQMEACPDDYDAWLVIHRKATAVCEGTKFVLGRVNAIAEVMRADVEWLDKILFHLDNSFGGIMGSWSTEEVFNAERIIYDAAQTYMQNLKDWYYIDVDLVLGM